MATHRPEYEAHILSAAAKICPRRLHRTWALIRIRIPAVDSASAHGQRAQAHADEWDPAAKRGEGAT
jgi:hypothetical protein